MDSSFDAKVDETNEFAFESYTISREHTQSPDIVELEFKAGSLTKETAVAAPQISNLGHPGIGMLPKSSLGSLVSSSPKRGHPGLGMPPSFMTEECSKSLESVLEVQTVGQLKVPQLGQTALSSPLGSVPSLNQPDNIPEEVGTIPGGPGSIPGQLGSVPGRGLGSIHGQFGAVPSGLGSVPEQFRSECTSSLLSVPLGSVPSDFSTSAPFSSSGGHDFIQSSCQRGPFTPFTRDSGLTSSVFSDAVDARKSDNISRENEADGMSDDGRRTANQMEEYFCDELIGGKLEDSEDKEESSDLEIALQKLTPAEVERRRNRLGMGKTYR